MECDTIYIQYRTYHAVPSGKVDGGGWVSWFDAHDAGFDLGWWSKVVASDLEELIDFGEELGVDRESAVEGLPGPGRQPESEFLLKHEDGAPKHGAVGQEFKDKARRDLVRDVGDTNIEERPFGFESIPLNNRETRFEGSVFDAL